MKLLYLSPSGGLGGAERVLLTVLEAVRRERPTCSPHLLVTADGPLVCRAQALGVPVTCVPLPASLSVLGDSGLGAAGRGVGWVGLARRVLAGVPSAWRYLRDLRRRVRSLAPDLVHSNGIKTHLLARLAVGGVPVVWHAHDFYGTRPVARRLLPRARRGVCGVIAISEAVRRDVQALLPGLPVVTVPNALDVDTFSPGPAEGEWLDHAAGLPSAPPGTVRVGLVATYARWKGHTVFLEAARLAARAAPATRFFLIGGPIYQTQGSQFTVEELQALAGRLGIAERVGFVGFQADPVRAYRALDVVVHASTQPEPFGLTIIEAMACRRAVIAAQSGGAAELFESGRDALGVPRGNAAALADAVAALAGDPGRRESLAAHARATAVARFNRERLGPQLWAAYDALLNATPQAAGGVVCSR